MIVVSGAIDAHTAGDVTDYLGGFLHIGQPLVVDASGLDFLGVAGLRALVAFAAACRQADQYWALVTSDAVDLLLRVAPDHRLPVVGSVDEALRRLAGLRHAQSQGRPMMVSAAKRC